MFSKEDRVLIKVLRTDKRYSARRLIREFPDRKWSLASINRLLYKIDGSADRKLGRGRRRSVRTDQNVQGVEKLPLSQEDASGTHKTVR